MILEWVKGKSVGAKAAKAKSKKGRKESGAMNRFSVTFHPTTRPSQPGARDIA